ncbi:MAG: hypothetical protein ACFHX7_06130 [Pseudomonadota bacterium]
MNDSLDPTDAAREDISGRISELFSIYKCNNLVGMGSSEFQDALTQRIGLVDAEAEGY